MIDNVFTKEAKKYYDTIREVEKNQSFIKLRDYIYAEMNTYKAENPDLSMLTLRSVLYEKLAESFEPVLLPYCPFYFEMGIRDARTYGGGAMGNIASWGVDPEVRYAPWRQDYIKEFGYLEEEPQLGIAWGPMFDEDHHCLGYTKIFEKGILGIIKDVDEMLQREPEGSEKSVFYMAAGRGLRALIKIADRFSKAAEEKLAISKDADERRYLMMIKETACKVPANPPKTFYEGLATILFVREVLQGMEGLGISVLGHVDRLLFPLYEADIQSGRMTKAEAVDILERWLCIPDLKCDAVKHKWADISTCVELGGCDADGKVVFNEVTELFINTHKRLNLINPKLNCRISKDSPQAYLELIGKALIEGHNVIALLNDEIIIPALIATGREERDARLYVNGGCQETITEGCEHSAGAMFYFNLARVLDLSLNATTKKGFCQKTIENLPKIIEEADSFEAFYAQYFENMKNMISYVVGVRREFGEKWTDMHPSPVFSSTLKGCLENGKDYTAGGAKYNPATIAAYGFATLTDSLFAIKKAVYEEKIITLMELKKALLQDWKGYEEIQAKCKKYLKYGHSMEEADTFAEKVFGDLNTFVMTLDNERGGKYVFSTFTFSHYLTGAPFVRATADGRNAGDVLGQSVGPSRIQKTESITDAIGSLKALHLEKSGGISVLDVMLPTNGNLTEELLADFLKAFTYSGGQVLQPNFVTVEQMQAAQKNPEEYKNLMVRVCGLSVYFVNLDKAFQDDMIARNRYASC